MITLDVATEVADAGLSPWVRATVPVGSRHSALREELSWAVTSAPTDLEFAASFARAQPQSGEPVEAYLNRSLEISRDLTVLVGPRYRGRDPHRPFVGIEASSRVLRESDFEALRATLRPAFSAFDPTYISFWSCVAARSWTGCDADLRDVVGRLTDLAEQPLPDALGVRVAADLDFYPRYRQIHEQHVALEAEHALHTRVEAQEDLADLMGQGLVFDVRVEGRWAGVLAACRAVQRGLRGYTVVELLLDPHVRGRGYGRHLSSALAASVLARADSSPVGEYLLGTIHVDNHRAYRSALAAGRRDVGGEVVVPL